MDTGIRISADTPKAELADRLDVCFHELSRPGTRVQLVSGPRGPARRGSIRSTGGSNTQLGVWRSEPVGS
jgi:hypothetical protein